MAELQKLEFKECPPHDMRFTGIISKRTAYGLIWLGRYEHHDCVIKMIMLTTGIHYDKNSKHYRNSKGVKIDDKLAGNYFGHDDEPPFNHIDFKHRRSMTPEAFHAELTELVGLDRLGLAPKVFGYGFNTSYPIHYGFIVMEKVPCSLKDIYLKRNISHEEKKLIQQLIDDLHYKHGIIHGDLKPSKDRKSVV